MAVVPGRFDQAPAGGLVVAFGDVSAVLIA
jgi:hypothetical protein